MIMLGLSYMKVYSWFLYTLSDTFTLCTCPVAYLDLGGALGAEAPPQILK